MNDLLALPLMASLGGLLVYLVTTAKLRKIVAMDSARKFYEITMPSDLSFDTSVLPFVRSLAGMKAHDTSYRYRLQEALGVHLDPPLTAVFETMSTPAGITFRMGIPVSFADYVVGQMRSQMPGVRVAIEKEHEVYPWTESVEVSTSSGIVPLRIPDPTWVIHTILAAFMPLKPDQALQLQWIVCPADPERTDKQHPDHKDKFSDHVFFVRGRISARAENTQEARRMIRRLYAALSSMNAYGVAFKQQNHHPLAISERVHDRRSPVHYGTVVNATELATLITPPVGEPPVPGLSRGRSRHLAADPQIAEEGIVVAQSNFPGNERPLAISPINLTKHLAITGPTGTGKSTLLVNLAVQQMEQGYGLCVIEPKGDLVADILERIPRNRLDDVIVLDPLDNEYPIAFNPLEGDNPYLVTDQQMALWDKLYGLQSMPRTADVFRSAVLTLAQQGMTLLDIPMLLGTSEGAKDFRHEVTRKLTDRALKNFWDDFSGRKVSDQTDIAAPLLRRLRPFELRPSLRATLGQVKSGIDIGQIIRDQKILLVPLSKGQLGEETSALFGALIVAKLWQEAQKRGSLPTSDRVPFFAMIDEFQNYLHLPLSIADLLAEARSTGLSLTLAHQNLDQLPPQLRSAVLANARSKVCFQATASDATALAREFSPYLSAADIQNLGSYEVVVRLATDGQMAPPATAVTMPAPPRTSSPRKIVEASREAYGRPVAEVEAEMAARYESFRRPHNKPDIGFEPPAEEAS